MSVFKVLLQLGAVAICSVTTTVVPSSQWSSERFEANPNSAKYDVMLLETALNELLGLNTHKWASINGEEAATTEPPTSSSSSDRKQLWKSFLREMVKIGSTECAQEMIRTMDVAVSAMGVVALCKMSNKTKAHCSDRWLRSREWALRILDAWGRPPAGLHSSGPFLWLGAFDQCLDVVVSDRANQSASYCLIDVDVADSPGGRKVNVRYGMCLPPPCNESDVLNMANITARLAKRAFGFWMEPIPIATCQSKMHSIISGEQPDRFVGKWITVGVIVLLILLVILGTFVDVYRSRLEALLQKKEKKMNDGDQSTAITQSRRRTRRISVQTEAESTVLTYKSAPAIKRTMTQRSAVIQVLRAFSARLSWRHIFRPVSKQSAHIRCLNGMRIVAALWVVVGHSYLMALPVVGNVRHLAFSVYDNILGELLMNASLAVDTFLLLSGTLVSFAFHRRLASSTTAQKRILSVGRWLVFYAHRITRLLPSYAFALAVLYSWYNELGDGPLWHKWVFGARCVPNDWWQHLLLISNFFTSECMPWMWFLALDWQFYLISPIFLILLNKCPKIGVAVTASGVIASAVYRMIIYFTYKFPYNVLLAMIKSEKLATEQAKQMFTLLYSAPQARIGPFLIGILLGWLLVTHRKDHSNDRRWLSVWAIKLGSVAALASSLFGGYFIKDQESAAGFVYGAVFRTVWALGSAMVIWQCQMGDLRVVQAVLGWDRWTPLARLGFGVYLIHEPLVLWFVWTRRLAWTPHSIVHAMLLPIAIATLSWTLALPMAVFVEAPPLTLERLLFKTVRRLQNHLRRRRTNSDLPMPCINPVQRTTEWIKSPDQKLTAVVCETVAVRRRSSYGSACSNATQDTPVELLSLLTEPFSSTSTQLDDELSAIYLAPADKPSTVIYRL